jgi:hypothetical protein
MDIWGPLSIPSISGFKYFLTIVDDKSRFTWIYLMKLKSETSILIQNFVKMIHTQFNAKVKCIRSDNGNEFKLVKFYHENGILHQTSCVNTPQQNGIVERKHQHILAITRALMFQSSIPKIFWAHAISHSVHIINRLPTPYLSHKSPFEILHNTLPDITNLKVFGSLCFATTLSSHRKKLDPRSRKCIHLGFKTGVKGYVLFDLKSKELFLSRDVVFFEAIFPYQVSTSTNDQSQPHLNHNSYDTYDDSFLDQQVTTNLSPTPVSDPVINTPTTSHNNPSSQIICLQPV